MKLLWFIVGRLIIFAAAVAAVALGIALGIYLYAVSFK